jgi:hypothetical protein
MKKLLILLSILLLPLASAYYRYTSPAQLLENEWVVFALIFLIFFALIFFALGKTFRENMMASLIISAGLSFFISAVLSQRINFYGYFGEGIGGIIFLIVFLIIFSFVLKAVYDIAGPIGLGVSIFLTGLFLGLTKWEYQEVIPYSVIDSQIFQIATNPWIIVPITIVTAILIFANRNKLKKDDYEETILRRRRRDYPGN